MSKALLNKIAVSDCLAYLKKVDDGFVDLAVIDPPYNLKKGSWDTFKSQAEFLSFTTKWVDALIPKLKDSASLYIFNTPLNAAYILQHLIKRGLYFQNWITWDKRDGFSYAKKSFCQNQETIIFCTKNDKHTFNYDAVRLPYESKDRIRLAAVKGIIKNGKRWYPNPGASFVVMYGMLPANVIKNKVGGRVQSQPHATMKPLEIIERIIRASSNENGVVLDCFVGSGTTAVASYNLKRNFLCCDYDRDFVALARNRLKQHAR